MELTQTEKDENAILDNIRHPDLPRWKESIIAELHGKFLGFIDAQGLIKGNEYESKTQEILQCSKRHIWVWDNDSSIDCQIVVCLNSIAFSVELGIYNKKEKKVIHRNKLENLRYKISNGTKPELTEGSQEKFDVLFNEFKDWFNKLKQ